MSIQTAIENLNVYNFKFEIPKNGFSYEQMFAPLKEFIHMCNCTCERDDDGYFCLHQHLRDDDDSAGRLMSNGDQIMIAHDDGSTVVIDNNIADEKFVVYVQLYPDSNVGYCSNPRIFLGRIIGQGFLPEESDMSFDISEFVKIGYVVR